VSGHELARYVDGRNCPRNGHGLTFMNVVVQSPGGAVKVPGRLGSGTAIVIPLPIAVPQPE